MPSLKTLRHQEVLFSRLFEELTQIRVDEPDKPLQVALKRKRRKRLTSDGKLNILAADHPARRVAKAGDDPLAMGDREDFLTRIVRIMSADAVDGVMATMDVLEELLLLHDLMQTKGLPAFLDGKLMIVSLNRGGLSGTAWEMNDPVTGPWPEQCAAWKMDGVKLLWRVCDSDAGSLETMRYCAKAIAEANRYKLPIFMEPLPVVKSGTEYKVVKTADALVPLIGAATALGDSSRYMWLKLPMCQEMSRIAMATTLPIVLLGGESADTQQFLQEVRDGMAASHNVRGAMIGRNVLYPSDQDPVEVAASVQEIVHKTGNPQIAGE